MSAYQAQTLMSWIESISNNVTEKRSDILACGYEWPQSFSWQWVSVSGEAQTRRTHAERTQLCDTHLDSKRKPCKCAPNYEHSVKMPCALAVIVLRVICQNIYQIVANSLIVSASLAFVIRSLKFLQRTGT